MMKLGISSYTLTWAVGVPGYAEPVRPLTAAGLIEQAAQDGLRLVQLADNIPLHQLAEEELAQIRETAVQLGVQLEIGTRGTDPELLLAYLALARRFDSRLVRTLITTPDTARAEADLARVLPYFEEAGITIAVENHGLHTTEQLTSLFSALNSSYVGSCLDTVNSFSALEAPASVITALSPYIVNLHIKDYDITRVKHQMGFEVLGTAAGSGRLNIPGLIEHLLALGKSPTAILELWTPYSGNVEDTIRLEEEWYRKSLAYLSQHFEN